MINKPPPFKGLNIRIPINISLREPGLLIRGQFRVWGLGPLRLHNDIYTSQNQLHVDRRCKTIYPHHTTYNYNSSRVFSTFFSSPLP